jgi:hypothetical protein
MATIPLPFTPFNGSPDPTGIFSPFVLIEFAFAGTMRSVVFDGANNIILIDNLQLGLASTGGNFFD